MNLTIPEEFPFTEKERKLFKAKLLMFLAWRASSRPCSVSECPLHCMTPQLNKDEDCLRLLINWIVEADID